MKITLLIISLSLLLTNVGCRKYSIHSDNPYGLPNATQDGKNMFACRINGQNAVARSSIYSIGAWMSFHRDTLNVSGDFGQDSYQSLTLGNLLKNRVINHPYDLSDSTITYFYYYSDSSCLGSGGRGGIVKVFKCSEGVIIYSKIDTLNYIVSGTFNCKFVAPGCDTTNITDGRFDIQYHF